MSDPLPVITIGGYLGSGKTTLLNHLLRHANGRRLAILVNEFGALPIDADLIEAEEDGMISIAGGCICCSFGNDLLAALRDLSEMQPRPDYVVIESSGVAIPGAITSPHSDALFDSLVLAPTLPVGAPALAKTLATGGHGIIRAKGHVVNTDTQTWLVQVVGNRWQAEPTPDKTASGIVCIGFQGQLDRWGLLSLT